ncbi:hypothetical protein [Paracoccus albus]|uniref:hypothetical protein n=1 Tax=Paracoccus albus TaxID=3017784 RepID=UPI0022F0B351|nr:hypothetical protein [Paracoccus albus]WBU60602.1 hypothetical protein PAF20_01355 [Paracoccus albus]
MEEPLSPEETQDRIALLVTMAVDSGFLPLHSAEKLLIYGIIDVREAVIDMPAGQRPIQVFEPTLIAISVAAILRTTSVPEPLAGREKGVGEGTAKCGFEALIPRGKRKWVLSRKYLESGDADNHRLMDGIVVRYWWNSVSH